MVGTTQTKSLLPPTERDANIYRLIVNDGVSTREAAAAAGVSQTRVRQIVKRVIHWLAETLPAELGDISPEAALRLAQSMAAERYQMFYCDAMNGWRQTGLAKYANLAFRATAAQARLPALLSTIDGLLADATAPSTTFESTTEEQVTNDQEQMTDDPPPPPIEDCSANPNCNPPLEKSPSAIPAATSCDPKPSDQLPPAKQAARKALFAAAEPLLTPSNHRPSPPAQPSDDLGLEQILRRADRRGRKLCQAK